MELLPFDQYVRSLNRKRMSAGVLFHGSDDRVLLVEPSYKPHWDIPGGAVEADEAPWTTAVRETREEIGLSLPLGSLLVIDYVPTGDRMPEGLAFVFDGGFVSDREVEKLPLTDSEIVSVGLYSMEVVAKKTKPSLAARIRTAIDAAKDGTVVLCENGERIVN